MAENQDPIGSSTAEAPPAEDGLVDAVLVERRGISMVWLVPAVAAVVGAWLAYTALTQRGPSITIRFESAAGLEANKTRIRFKDVEVGKVEAIELSDDLSRVDVHARLGKGAERYLTDQTRFWVVRAQISAGQISGLSTILSGAYIGIDPSTEGQPANNFVGLERPPPFTSDVPGRTFKLRGDTLGSLDLGSPVYFRWITVGSVVSYELDPEGDHVTLEVFVREPHDQRVRENSRFWNASGLDVSLSPEGIQVDSISLASILVGGVAFETPRLPIPAPKANEETVFRLYPNKRAAKRPIIGIKVPFQLHFEQSAAGLVAGSPVDFQGIVVGQVRDVSLTFDERILRPRISVLIDIEPERVRVTDVEISRERWREIWDAMVAQGLRARLSTHNLLTGQLEVTLDFHPGASPAEIDWEARIPEIPTVPSPIEELKAGLGEFMAKINALPLEPIGRELESSLARLNAVLRDLEQTTPALTGALERAEQTLGSIEELVAPDSQASVDLKRALREVADGARALRLLAEELEQKPEILIRGRP